ncbi:MAG: hypothetical protein K0R27_2491 [Xanthobacteraceae bacterium]|jgi:hypothetical protein|nr:hypothetical protein [Xanthobacteraceae bacterium]
MRPILLTIAPLLVVGLSLCAWGDEREQNFIVRLPTAELSIPEKYLSIKFHPGDPYLNVEKISFGFKMPNLGPPKNKYNFLTPGVDRPNSVQDRSYLVAVIDLSFNVEGGGERDPASMRRSLLSLLPTGLTPGTEGGLNVYTISQGSAPSGLKWYTPSQPAEVDMLVSCDAAHVPRANCAGFFRIRDEGIHFFARFPADQRSEWKQIASGVKELLTTWKRN